MGEELTLVSWGGMHGLGLQKSYLAPFEESTGITIKLQHYNGGISQLREQVGSNSVIWDVVDLADTDAERACDEGLLEVLPLEQLQETAGELIVEDDFLPGSLLPCAVGYAAWSMVFVHRTGDTEYQQPTALPDLFDLENFPGKRGLRRSPQGLLEWALLADGVDAAQLYSELATEQGLQRAFDKLRTIKAHIVWWQQPDEMQSLLESETVSMGAAYSSSVFAAVARDGQKLGIVWDSHLLNTHYFGVTKGTFRFSPAWQFVRFVSRPDRMAMISNYLGYAPMRQSAQQRIRDQYRSLLPTAEEHYTRAVRVDKQWWREHRSRLNQRFAEWLVDIDGG